MIATAPMISAILGSIFLKEPPDKKTWISIIITFLAIIYIFGDFDVVKFIILESTFLLLLSLFLLKNLVLGPDKLEVKQGDLFQLLKKSRWFLLILPLVHRLAGILVLGIVPSQ